MILVKNKSEMKILLSRLLSDRIYGCLMKTFSKLKKVITHRIKSFTWWIFLKISRLYRYLGVSIGLWYHFTLFTQTKRPTWWTSMDSASSVLILKFSRTFFLNLKLWDSSKLWVDSLKLRVSKFLAMMKGKVMLRASGETWSMSTSSLKP